MPDAKLPNELWREIFRQAVSVPLLLDTRWDYDPSEYIWNDWITKRASDSSPIVLQEDSARQTRQSLVQVCRSWRSIAEEFLFEVVQLPEKPNARSRRQLRRLIEIFKSSTRSSASDVPTVLELYGYGWWTKRIDCPTHFLEEESADGFFELLERCHNVEILIIQPGDLSELDVIHKRLTGILNTRFPHSLRRFSYMVEESLSAAWDMSLTMPNILLQTLDAIHREDGHGLPPPVLLVTITSLSLWFPYAIRISPLWNCPNLQHLGLLFISNDDIPLLVPFVQRHGDTLTSLFIILVDGEADQLADLLLAAPQLSSLTLEDEDLAALPRETPLPGITHVGILHGKSDSMQVTLRKLVEHRTFPDLRCFRFLHSLPPSADGESWEDTARELVARHVRTEEPSGRMIVAPDSNPQG